MHIDDRAIYDLTHDLILKIGIDGRISAANAPASRALGYTRAELVRMSIREILSPDSLMECESCLETAKGNVPVHGAHLTFMTADGRALQLQASFHPRQTEEGTFAYGVFHSLTEEEQVRRELRESERQLRTLLSAVPDVLLVLDQRGQFRQIHTASEDMLVAPAEQMVGKTLADVLSHDEAELGRETINAVIDTQQPVHLEYQLDLGETSRWFSARVVPFGSDCDPCVLWVARDITSLMQARQKVQEDQQLLRSLLELETKAREIVAYEIHDGFVQYAVGTQMWLQNVMQDIHLFSEQTAKAIRIATDSLNQAVDDARSMIRDLRPVIVDEEGVAHGLHQLIDVMRKTTDMPIEFHCGFVPSPMLKLLEGQVFRIVQESLNNAIRHSGGDRVTVRLNGSPADVHIEIVDDGKGFDPEQVPPDRYGLEGIHQRARVFGGVAQVVSRPGSGTRISVRLPMIPRKVSRRTGLPFPDALERGV